MSKKLCPECHHRISCRFDGQGRCCYCDCHDLAEDAPILLFFLTTIIAEAACGNVKDVTVRKAAEVLQKHNGKSFVDCLVEEVIKQTMKPSNEHV